MKSKIEVFGGLPPHCETGYVSSISEAKTQGGDFYAKVLLEVPQGSKRKNTVEVLPFFFAPNIWKKYKSLLHEGDVWTFQFNLTSNKSGGNYFLNAAVIKANSFKIINDGNIPSSNHEQSKGDSQQLPNSASNNLQQFDFDEVT